MQIAISEEVSKNNASNKTIDQCIRQLDGYFKGKRKTFSLPLLLIGTEFQKKVWNMLSKIPYGEIISYKSLAQSIGHSKAYRAVGTANAKNNFPIIIPCHRVISANGRLGGYALGLDVKIKLLGLEKVPLTTT